MLKKRLFNSILSLLIIAALAIPFIIPQQAQAAEGDWYGDWSYRKLITIDSTKIDDALADFPVLVHLDNTNFDFSHAQNDGEDIRFMSTDNTTIYDYEREYHNDVAEQGWYWVESPPVGSGADTEFYMYYGNAGAADGENVTGVWDANFVAVYHLSDDDADTAVTESTGSHAGTKRANAEPTQWTNGYIHYAQHFDGNNDYIGAADHADFDLTSAMTLEAFVYDDGAASKFIVSKRIDPDKAYTMIVNGSDQPETYIYIGSAAKNTTGTTSIDDATWHYICGRYDDADPNDYVMNRIDVAADTTQDSGGGNIDTNDDDFRIGWGYQDTYSFDGKIDEVRVSNVKRTDAWCKASSYSGHDDLLTIGAEETPAAPVVPAEMPDPRCTGRGRDWGVLTGFMPVTFPNDADTVGFQYGLWGEPNFIGDINKSDSFGENDVFSIVAQNLNYGTPYQFRSYATVNATTYYSDNATFSTLGSPSLFEYLNTGCDGDSTWIYSANWTYQAFTSESTAHSVSSVRVNVRRVGYPGDVELAIKYANAAIDEPTGADLAVATLDGDTFSTSYAWREFVFDTPLYSLEASTPYAIVLRALSGDASNYVEWCIDSGGALANAIYGVSSDGGITWTADGGGADAMFEIWGYPSLQVNNAIVVTGYRESGDWLICSLIDNTFPPYYNDNDDPAKWFYLQFVDTETQVVEASVPCRDWERQPLGIYMDEDEVTDLTWSGNYTMRLTLYDGSEYQEYPLVATDWRSDDMVYLDQWVITSARGLEEYYGLDLLSRDILKFGKVILNNVGGAMFARGIPALTSWRPELFEDVEAVELHTEEDWTRGYETSRDWEAMIGTEAVNLLTSWTSVLGVEESDIKTLASIIYIALFIILLILVGGKVLGGWFGGIVGIGWVWLGGYIGILSLTAIVVLYSVLAFVFVFTYIWSRG